MKTITKILIIGLLYTALFSCTSSNTIDIKGKYHKTKENDRGHSLNVFGSGLVSELEFKEKYCHFVYFGNPMSAEYEVVKNNIYVKVGGELGTLTFEIIDSETLEGDGWASGTFKKHKTK